MYSRYLLIQSTYNRSPSAMAKGPEGMPTETSSPPKWTTRTGWKCVVTRAERYGMYDGHCPMEDRNQVGTRVGFFEPSYYS
jgi:hypothetical protein